MDHRLETLLSATLGLAAVAIAISTIHRAFSSGAEGQDTQRSVRGEYVENWERVSRRGIPMGDTSGSIQILEFADFQCPYCKRYEPTLRRIEAKYRGQVARVFVHWPLPGHRYALDAARAAECAADQSRFVAMHDALYGKQDSIGIRPWSAFAKDAAITDLERFARCVERDDALPRVRSGVAIADSLRLTGTPTIIVNGWKFAGGAPEPVLDSLIDRLIADHRRK